MISATEASNVIHIRTGITICAAPVKVPAMYPAASVGVFSFVSGTDGVLIYSAGYLLRRL
ncbi:MAG: hypothetical protein ACI9UA_002429 [Pseudoalteromonas tetraodonis]|jgi:hypothetical protein